MLFWMGGMLAVLTGEVLSREMRHASIGVVYHRSVRLCVSHAMTQNVVGGNIHSNVKENMLYD